MYFKVVEINTGEDGKEMALLKGIDHRLLIKYPVEELVKVKTFEVDHYWHNVFAKNVEQVKQVLSRHQQEHAVNVARALGGVKENGEDI
ncbi:hypothetical protein DCCM_4106 [Desulfocucumis palustris]|uniref:Uncharacterized protein n=1 Tax=Desulfocucumis palustris TaxID=1898651 RepID=A0A2L2XFH8_9FIRM|nr:hypothetical protein DCCM_4106 [Desulfocucumis palustris]